MYKVIKKVNPQRLYPMVTIESISPDTLEQTTCRMKDENEISIIRVIDFKGYYIMLDGFYEMLAANIIGKSEIEIEVVPLTECNTWISERTIKEQLKTVGMNALYDFEALGGFKYSEYPTFYNEEK